MLRNLSSVALIAMVSFAMTAAPVLAGVSAVGEIKTTPQNHPGLILDQFYLGCLSHASYLIGDPVSKTAVVVDPQRDVSQYVEEAKKQGLKITHVFLTHVHADFVAGHLELERKVGAKICLGAKTTASFPFTKLKDGDAIDLGDVQLKVLDTPGHTPEAISFLFSILRSAKTNHMRC